MWTETVDNIFMSLPPTITENVEAVIEVSIKNDNWKLNQNSPYIFFYWKIDKRQFKG